MRPLIVVCLVLGAVGMLSGCGSAAKPAPGTGCALNSDCATGLICTFGLCHTACVPNAANGDCPAPELCVKSSAGTDGGGSDGGGTNICQLPAELTCVYNSDCKTPLVCARDEQCRNQCQASVDCVSPQVCTDSKVCALPSQLVPGTNDVSLVTTGQTDGGADARGSGGGGGRGATTGTGGSGGAATTGAGGAAGGAGKSGAGGTTTCSGAQLEFANISQGDANPGFTSAVAVRNADTLFIFSAYEGPAPVDGGVDGGALAGNAIFVQMFDPVTGIKRGPNQFLLSVPYRPAFGMDDVAVAPTGEIALLYSAGPGNNYADQLYMTTVATAPGDGGIDSLSVERTVQLESVSHGSPRVIWQPATQLFVFSWKYQGSNGWYARVRTYHPNGTASGAAINAIPTITNLFDPGTEDDAYVGVSGTYLALAYQSTNAWPYLTIVDGDGFQVGPFITLQAGSIDNWAACAGTTTGFVAMFTGGGRISGAFVPLTGMNSVISDAGVPDGGLPPLKTFSFPSTATTGKMINDDFGGGGGAAAVLLENDGAAFVYVSADGSKAQDQGSVISAAGGIQAGISNFAGSFVVSLFNGTTHSAQATVSNCQ